MPPVRTEIVPSKNSNNSNLAKIARFLLQVTSLLLPNTVNLFLLQNTASVKRKPNLIFLDKPLLQMISTYLLPGECHSLLLTAHIFRIVYTTPLRFSKINLDKIQTGMTNTRFPVVEATVHTQLATHLVLPLCIKQNLRVLKLIPDNWCSISNFNALKECPNLEVFCSTNDSENYKPIGSVLQHCTRLRHIELTDYGYLGDIQFVSSLINLTHLSITRSQISNVVALSNCPRLEYLKLESCGAVDIDGLSTLTSLNTFIFLGFHPINMQNLIGCSNLINLTLRPYITYDYKITAPNVFPKLKHLSMMDTTTLQFLPSLPSVETLDMFRNSSVSNLRGIDNVINLTQLELRGCTRLTSIAGLRVCSRLVQLKLFDLDMIEGKPILDLSELEHCPTIKQLYLEQINMPVKLPYCQHLEFLSIRKCNTTKINFSSATRLIRLELVNLVDIFELTQLQSCSTLEVLYLAGKCIITPSNLGFLSRLRKLKFARCDFYYRDCSWMYDSSLIQTIHLVAPGEMDINVISNIGTARTVNKLIISQAVGRGPNFLDIAFSYIRILHVKECTSIEGMEYVKYMPFLENIRMIRCSITSLYFLSESISLLTLTLNSCRYYKGQDCINILDFTLKNCNGDGNTLRTAITTRLYDPLREQLLALCFDKPYYM